MKKCTIACVIGLLSVCILKGQPVEIRQFHTKSFNVNEGLLQSHISDMAFDSLNFGWLSFENGIQRFDGQRFYEVPLQPGLPDDKGVSFFTTNDGSLLISHAKGITRYLPSSHSFKQEYLIPYNTIFPLRPVGEYNDATWWLTEKGMLIGLRNKTFEQVYNEALPFKKKPETFWMRRVAISNLLNGHVAFAIDSLMFVWNITARKVSATVSLEMNIPSVLPYLLSDHSFIIQTSYELTDIFYINSGIINKNVI
ncbi:MAG: hypothetical protein MUE99_05215 [Chitinophagaceae bacterium]|nr:hypothetical protein [Chitinophagaceae bacterium]